MAALLVLLCVMLSCVFVTFQYVVLAKVCYLIVLISDLGLISYFDMYNNNKTERMQETPEFDKMFSKDHCYIPLY